MQFFKVMLVLVLASPLSVQIPSFRNRWFIHRRLGRSTYNEGPRNDGVWDKANREGALPNISHGKDLRRLSVKIANAQDILLDGLQQYLGNPNSDLETCLRQMINRTDPYVDEYGEEIRSYKKIFRFIWQQYNETLVHNYAISQFNKDKLDMCSVARFLSHKSVVKNRNTVMKRMSNALNYTCHPCTPYKRKEHSEIVVPTMEGISPEGLSPEESLTLCKGFEMILIQNLTTSPPDPSIPTLNIKTEPPSEFVEVSNVTIDEPCVATRSDDSFQNIKNRDCQLYPSSLILDVQNKSGKIVEAHEVIRKVFQQFLNARDTDIGTYLHLMIQRSEPYVDEYGQVIHHYKKVFKFIWEQYNETIMNNYAANQFDKDKLDLCSVARFFSHQHEVKERRTLMKRMSDALGYKCHPCTPYKRKQYGETIVPNTEGISEEGVSPEESLIVCNKGYQTQIANASSSLRSTYEIVLNENENKDKPCHDIGGNCKDWRTNFCRGSYLRGLCSGDLNNRCCRPCGLECEINLDAWSATDSACESSGGTCMDMTNYCSSPYQRGKCGGSSTRRCCPL